MPRPADDDDEPFVPDLSEGAESGLYLALFELLDEGLIVTGDERILEANSAACRLLERSYGELVGRPLAELFPSEQAFLAARARLFIQGQMRGSLQLALPGGRHRDMRFCAAARLRPGIHALVLAPDYLAEAGAVASADPLWPRLAAALEQPVIVVDGAGQVVAANAAALRRLGLARAELVGRRLEECLGVAWPGAEGESLARLRLPGGEELAARLLPGPKPEWCLLLLPAEREGGGRAIPPPASSGEAAFRASFDPCPLPALLVEAAGHRVRAVNPAARRLLARPPRAGAASLQDLGYRPAGADLWQITLADGSVWQAELLTYALEPGLEILLHDLPDTPLLSGRLRLPAAVLQAADQALLVCDGAGRILAVNQAFSRATGYAPEEVHGQDPGLFLARGPREDFFPALAAQLARDQRWEGEVACRRKDGASVAEWLTLTALRNPRGEVVHYVGQLADLAARQQAAARGDYLARHDALTGLPSLRELAERFAEARQRARRRRGLVAVLKVKVEQLAAVNEDYGHALGDRLLQRVAQRLRAALPAGASVARKQGDAFVALLPALLRQGEAEAAARALIAALAPPLTVDGLILEGAPAIGVAIYPGDGSSLETLLRHAELARRQAGPGEVGLYADEIKPQELERRALAASLAHAIERRQLELHFVPEWRGPRPLAAEALLRWRHPDLGLLPTRRLLPLLEHGGLWPGFGAWALRQACGQAARWGAAGREVTVVVNIALAQLADPGFPALVREALADTGLAPELLELDLEEALLAEGEDGHGGVLGELAGLGVRLAIDNFGQGLSSLRRLGSLPVTTLRLAPALVEAGLATPAVLEATLALARSLNLAVVAKGVADEAARARLAALGLTALQGRAIGGPLEAAAFARSHLEL